MCPCLLRATWYQWQVSLVLQVSLGQRDLQGHLVHQVRMAWVMLDLRDPLDPPDNQAAPLQANLAPQVDLANLECLENLVRGETPEPLVLRDQGDSLALLEAQDLLVCLQLANRALPAFLEQWDQEESLA